MDQLLELDKKLFLALNGYHNPWLDQLMIVLTNTTAWIPLYLLLLYLIIKNFGKEAWIVLLAIGLTVLLTDQLTSAVMKPFFARLRPSHEPALEGLVVTVNHYKGGKFGFASGHAANTFGVAMLMWLLLKRYRPWTGLLFLWALAVGYTRVYLGVHYPGDILAGACVGLLCALVVYLLFTFLNQTLKKKETH